jgi:hypothetical protein
MAKLIDIVEGSFPGISTLCTEPVIPRQYIINAGNSLRLISMVNLQLVEIDVTRAR